MTSAGTLGEVLAGEARWVVLRTDCEAVLADMREASVDAVISDPPYGINVAEWDGDIPAQAVLTDCLRIAQGAVCWFGTSVTRMMLAFARYEPQPERCLIWTPSFSLSVSGKGNVMYRWHPIWCWRLKAPRGALPLDVLDDPTEGHNPWNHPATKPVSLMKRIIAATVPPGGVVVDPYTGSGSTGVAALELGRRFVGIEREAAYVEIARGRLADACERQQGVLPGIDITGGDEQMSFADAVGIGRKRRRVAR